MATVVAKIGSSSLTSDSGRIDPQPIARVAAQVRALRERGDRVVVVSSGAVAAGLGALGYTRRPSDRLTLQAVSAVGQSRMMREWDDAFTAHGLVSGQVLLVPHDFFDRTQYLHARSTITHLLDLGVVPVINENDAIADDELRFGDNDRIAALVSHLIAAEVLVLLTDTAGLYTGDPRTDPSATLIEHVAEVTPELEAAAGGVGSARGSGGMSSKLRAAKIASWSGVRAVIASSGRERGLLDAVDGVPGAGTVVAARTQSLPARKLWIAFAVEVVGSLTVDAGAADALLRRGVSLLAPGVASVDADFEEGDAIDVRGPDGAAVARGLARCSSDALRKVLGLRAAELDDDAPRLVVHRDDLALTP